MIHPDQDAVTLINRPNLMMTADVFLTMASNVTEEHLDIGWRWCWVSELDIVPIPWRVDIVPTVLDAVVVVHSVAVD